MSRFYKDALLVWTLRVAAATAGIIVLLILLFLVGESIPALTHIGWVRFFSDPSWHPAANAAEGSYNLTPILIGTVWATVGAVLLATPLGVFSALFCRYFAPPRLASIYRRLLELLAGIPSVVYGFWGLVVLVPIIARWSPPGMSLLAGILILAIMILPTAALVSDAALEEVPHSYLQGASALGLSRWRTLGSVVLPAARPGLITGIILETGRAIGETMAILMVAGNIVRSPDNLFDPIRTLTANIALEMAYAMGDHRSALFVTGLLLMIIVMTLVFTAEFLARDNQHG